MKKLRPVSKVSVENKHVLVRIDINSPVEKGKLQLSPRIKSALNSLLFLSKQNARVVAIAHQGRRGEPDFISLRAHAKMMNRILKKTKSKIRVKFVPALYEARAIEAIKRLKPGEILLLENTRFYPEETRRCNAKEHAKSRIVTRLSQHAELFVQDAFSVLHREHATVIGFPLVLPSYIGPLLEKELYYADKIRNMKALYILGGAKPSDYIGLAKKVLARGSKILACGLFAQAMYVASGKSLGAQDSYLKKKGCLEQRQELARLAKKASMLKPIDFAVLKNNRRHEASIEEFPLSYEIFDIGKKTITLYKEEIKKARACFIKGTPGYYLDKKFVKGTKEIMLEVAKKKTAVIGGGDTATAAERLGLAKKFSAVILSGGALLRYLAGEKLPGLEVMRR